ncbi:hypothetical protein [Diaminobutyricimonas sp. LJ205]|uniref:hypothetical protein n=1 Tax=Diaminobutyricimonas sp. LJ205 TaxID=2683590 RepID=UPI0012F50E6A|nr:hypothetical protein [Diaminobutyricimonas sp. LJ205]
MHPSIANDYRRSSRHVGTNALARMLAVAAIAGLILGGSSPAWATTAEPTPPAQKQTQTPTATPTPDVTKESTPTAAPPDLTYQITPTPAGDFIPQNRLSLTGTATTGNKVVVADGAATVCSAEVKDGAWSCVGDVSNGGVTLTIRETLPNGSVEEETSAKLRVLGPPTVDGPSPVVTTGLISGVGYPNALITVDVTGPVSFTQSACPAALTSGFWSCALSSGGEFPDGTYRVTVRQGAPDTGQFSNPSAAMTVVIDKTAPASPTIDSVRAGDRVIVQPHTISGAGEDGGVVDLFINRDRHCSVPVTGGRWACDVSGIPAGDHTFQVLQRDAAGNYSAVSDGFVVVFGMPHTSTPSPTPTATPTPTPSETTDPQTASPTPAPSPSDPPGATSPPDTPPQQAPPTPLTWGTPTDFGVQIPSLASFAEHGTLWVAPLLALAFALLVALPLRLVYPLLAARIPRPGRLTGRNQAVSAEDEDTPLVKPWVVIAGSVFGMALLAALSGGILGEVRYLRLVVAIGIGLVVLNGVGIVASSWLAARKLRVAMWFRFVPGYLGLAAVAALASRMIGIEPPVILGVIIASTVPMIAGQAARGVIGLAQLVTLAALATAAWAAHTAIGPVDGFWASLFSESLAAICLAGFGSAVLLTLPLRALPGRLVYEWSKPAWVIVTLVVVTLAAAVLMAHTGALVVGAFLLAGAFAAVACAIWGWVRFVEPARH